MKQFIRMIALLFIVFFASHAFSKTLKVTCPSISVINKNKNFTAAIPVNTKNFWGLLSQEFSYLSEDWNIVFLVALPNATNQDEALTQGEKILKNVTLTPPVSKQVQGHTVCIYAMSKNYALTAINPPISMPNITLSALSH